MLVAVPGSAGPELRPVRTLLPDAYRFPEGHARRILRFNKRYYGAITEGTKTTTIRYQDHRTLDGEVTLVNRHRLDQMTPEQAGSRPGITTEELRAGLRHHYPDLPDDAEVDVVTFRLAAP